MLTGYVLGEAAAEPGIKIRAIAGLLDQAPAFPEKMIPLFRWVSRYYHHPLGEVIRAALPGGFTTQSGHRLGLSDAGRRYFQEEQPAIRQAHPWLAELLAGRDLSPAAVRRLRLGKEKRFLEQWAAQGLLTLAQVISKERISRKTEVWALSLPGVAIPALKPAEEKTLALLREMEAVPGQGLPRRELLAAYRGAGKAGASLAEKGLLRLEERPVYRDPFGEPLAFSPKPATLSREQNEVMARLGPALAAKRFVPFLLHGVTGSGKTEVYLRAAELALSQGRGVLVLVPEIALATQLEAQFLSRFGDEVALMHSGLGQGQRFDQWQRVLSGKARVVLGARSAIFAPLADPGLIIVDEEHDPAYKQEDGLRYQARDLALVRGSQNAATVILGSATPSLVSYQHAQNGKYTLLSMAGRVENRPLPAVELVDLMEVPTVAGRPPLFSPLLRQALRETLNRGEQSLIFLNRRGFANFMLCNDCGQAVQCPHCRVTLTLHKGRGELLCHYCGFTSPGRAVCGNCRSGNLSPMGFGTERLEDELAGMFPKARIARLDYDTTRKRREFFAILRAVHAREVDILVGTQMITKGHHFPGVTLVGIIRADAGLGLPDYKAGERTFQLLTQVTGRAGRGEQPGRVIVQSHQPEHYSITAACAHDYQGFFTKEAGLRRALAYPPFSRLVNLIFDGEDEAVVQARAQALGEFARKQRRPQKTEALGPAPAPLARLRNRFRWQLLIKGPHLKELHNLCRKLADEHARLGGAVRLSVDVDPENML